MNKVIFNSSYGGFSLSKEAAEWLVEHGSNKIRIYSVPELNDTFIEWNGTKHDPLLVQCVKELKDKASGRYARLEIATIKGDKYMIYEYDGLEEIIDPETCKWIVIDSSEDKEK